MKSIIVVCNIRQSVHRAFGLSLHQHIQSIYGMHLLPIVTNPSEGIQERAKKISQQLPRLMTSLQLQKAHFACYSAAGIDFRFAVSEMGMAQYCKTITTISSPHKGSKLALLSDRQFFKPEQIDAVGRIAGIGLRPFHEFTPENMANFNCCVLNANNIEYYSMGSEKMPNLCSEGLKDTAKYLQEKTQSNYVYYNDGVFGHDEIVWGQHLANFEVDHSEVIGILGDKHNCLALQALQEISENYELNHTNNLSGLIH